MNDKMREEFEAWVKSEFDGYFPLRSGDGYTVKYIDGAWNGWKASRAALCVEMPRCWNDEQRDYRDDMVKSLDSAGVSHK